MEGREEVVMVVATEGAARVAAAMEVEVMVEGRVGGETVAAMEAEVMVEVMVGGERGEVMVVGRAEVEVMVAVATVAATEGATKVEGREEVVMVVRWRLGLRARVWACPVLQRCARNRLLRNAPL